MVAITVAIIRPPGAILKVLLSEADFFVDEKDLQTFVGAAFQPRFFLPLAFRGMITLLAAAGCRACSGKLEAGRHAPIFHYVVSGVHRG